MQENRTAFPCNSIREIIIQNNKDIIQRIGPTQPLMAKLMGPHISTVVIIGVFRIIRPHIRQRYRLAMHMRRIKPNPIRPIPTPHNLKRPARRDSIALATLYANATVPNRAWHLDPLKSRTPVCNHKVIESRQNKCPLFLAFTSR